MPGVVITIRTDLKVKGKEDTLECLEYMISNVQDSTK